jgi:hypothetical protein
MLIIAALCAAPVIASYLAFYVWQPAGRINYGDLLELRPLPESALSHLDGRPFRFAELRGKWVMLTIDSGACAKACEDRLFMMRQTRLMQGRDAERIERVFLITDEIPLSTMLLREYDGTRMIRTGTLPDAFPASGSRSDHIYLADPRGNLMLRFPKDPDPNGVKKDLERLLRAQGASPG